MSEPKFKESKCFVGEVMELEDDYGKIEIIGSDGRS